MGTRLELQEILDGIEGVTIDFFQTSESIRMTYPCIVYSLEDVDTRYANNFPYGFDKCYTVIVIDRDPDSEIPDRIGALPMSKFKTKYEKENLNHFVYRLYF